VGLVILVGRSVLVQLLRSSCSLSPNRRGAGWRPDQDRIERHRCFYDIDPGWIWEGPRTDLRSSSDMRQRSTSAKRGCSFLPLRAYREPLTIFGRAINNFSVQWPISGACLSRPTANPTGIDTAHDKRSWRFMSCSPSGPRDVPFAVLPRLGRFRDLNEPLSLTPVSPYDLAASFGPGVELKRVILQLTNDPVTPPPAVWPQWLTKKGYTYDYDRILFHMPRTDVTSTVLSTNVRFWHFSDLPRCPT